MKELDQLVENFFQPKRDTLGLDQLVEMVEEIMSEMSVGVKGFQYEADVIDALKSANAVGNISSGAGASAAAADADIRIGDNIYNVEVKLDSNAQMGGTSLKYFPQGVPSDDPQDPPGTITKFEIVSESVDTDTVTLMEEALMPLENDLSNLLSAIEADKIPATVEVEKWVAAKENGLLKPLNVKIKRSTQFIINHYKKKGVNYIQIGGAGLFYLADNPANLPVPRLDGEINIELRPGRSGSKMRKDGTKVAGVGLRVQGRLQFDGTSPYTLDDPESIREMLDSISKNNT